MAFNQNNNQGKQHEQTDKTADAAKASFNKATEQSTQFVDAARDGVNKMVDLREQATENTKQVVQKSVETASHQAREAADRFTKTLGFSGEDSERLARQSKQNMEAVTRCGTVLTQAFQDVSRSWFGLAQKQFQHNLEGMNKLVRAKSLQEFTAIQSDLIRESLQHMVQDSKAITETSARAVEEASKTFSSVAQQSPTLVR
ncbi:phasin family protein [Methylobacterium soli]|uniref:Phasin family protein n=1 Tax=Methylobacterium soli TaxID=553447 RepID=A0A6L3SNN1_9HYPH|nr:phasin family protein [Methylobacterium soli]KAB1069542.1 phasin family protein [Methylobacterium soli]